MSRDVHSCTHWLRPRNPPPPAFGLVYEGAIGQQRQTTSLFNPLVWCLYRYLVHDVGTVPLVRPCIPVGRLASGWGRAAGGEPGRSRPPPARR
jgi:hypothetical protein